MRKKYSPAVNKGARKIAVNKVRGIVSDVRRGQLLHKQGYGKTYEGALSIARKGKTGRKKRR